MNRTLFLLVSVIIVSIVLESCGSPQGQIGQSAFEKQIPTEASRGQPTATATRMPMPTATPPPTPRPMATATPTPRAQVNLERPSQKGSVILPSELQDKIQVAFDAYTVSNPQGYAQGTRLLSTSLTLRNTSSLVIRDYFVLYLRLKDSLGNVISESRNFYNYDEQQAPIRPGRVRRYPIEAVMPLDKTFAQYEIAVEKVSFTAPYEIEPQLTPKDPGYVVKVFYQAFKEKRYSDAEQYLDSFWKEEVQKKGGLGQYYQATPWLTFVEITIVGQTPTHEGYGNKVTLILSDKDGVETVIHQQLLKRGDTWKIAL